MAEATSMPIPETVEQALRLWDAGEPVTTVSMGGLGEPYEQCIQNLAFELMREWHSLDWPPLDEDVSEDLVTKLRESGYRISAELDKTHRFSGDQVGAAKNIAAIVCRQGYREALSHPEIADRLITMTKKAPDWEAAREGDTK